MNNLPKISIPKTGNLTKVIRMFYGTDDYGFGFYLKEPYKIVLIVMLIASIAIAFYSLGKIEKKWHTVRVLCIILAVISAFFLFIFGELFV